MSACRLNTVLQNLFGCVNTDSLVRRSTHISQGHLHNIYIATGKNYSSCTVHSSFKWTRWKHF